MGETASKAGAAVKRFLMGVAVLCLSGLVIYLLSERNARSYGVELTGGELVVTRGRMLPFGMRVWAPADRVLAEAYAPLPLIGESPGDLLLTRFDDRDALDRALFRTLRTWAEPRVEAEDPVRLREAVGLLRRMELLSGISDEQRTQLADIRSRVAWFEGRTRLEEALETLQAATSRLKAAADAKGRFSKDAGLLYDRVHPLVERIGQQARAAARGEQLDAIPADAAEAGATEPATGGLVQPDGTTPPQPPAEPSTADAGTAEVATP